MSEFIKENMNTRSFYLVSLKKGWTTTFSKGWELSRPYYHDDTGLELGEEILKYSFDREEKANVWADEWFEGAFPTDMGGNTKREDIKVSEYHMKMVIQEVEADYHDEIESPIQESRWDSNPNKSSFYITQYKGQKDSYQYDKDIGKFLIMGGKGLYFGSGITLSNGRSGIIQLSGNVFEKASTSELINGVVSGRDANAMIRHYNKNLYDSSRFIYEKVEVGVFINKLDDEYNELQTPIDESVPIVENFNLNTLKKFKEFGGEIYVTVKGRLNKNKKPRIFRVYDMDVKDIHDGTLRVRDGRAEFDIKHDDISTTITGRELERMKETEERKKALESVQVQMFKEFCNNI